MNASTQGLTNTDPRAAASTRLESLRRYFEAEPNNARLRRDVLNTAVAAGEFGYVRELAERRLADEPADAEAQFDRATALIGLNDFAAALEALQPLDATVPGVRFNIGFCHFMLGDYAAARPFFQAGYEAGERSAGQLRCFARTLHHLGSIDEAMEVVKSNEALVLSDGDLAGVAALLALDGDDQQLAAKWSQRALATHPHNLDALVSLGTVQAAQLEFTGARGAFERALAVQPGSGRAWAGLGALTMADQNFPAAIEQLERAVQHLPEHVGSWHALAWAHIFNGNLDAAEGLFKHALELNRNFCESHGSLAVIAAMRGDRAAAERGIEIAERLDRNCMTSKYAMTLLASTPEKGRAMLIDLVETLPGHGPKFAAFLKQGEKTSKRP